MSREVVDAIVGSPEQIFGVGSSVASGEVTYLVGDVQEGSAAAIFGEGSEVVVSDAIINSASSLVEQPIFQYVLLLSLLFYLSVMVRSWGFMVILWGGFKNSLGIERMENEGGKLMLSRFNMMIALLGIVVVALVGVRVVDGVIPDATTPFVGDYALYAPLLSLVVMGVVVAWLYALHRIAEWLSGSSVVGEVASLSLANFVRGVVLLYPVVAAWLVASPGSVATWTMVVVVLFGLLFLVYLKESLQLFIDKNISILYWILYLCGAIALPISFVAALLMGK